MSASGPYDTLAIQILLVAAAIPSGSFHCNVFRTCPSYSSLSPCDWLSFSDFQLTEQSDSLLPAGQTVTGPKLNDTQRMLLLYYRYYNTHMMEPGERQRILYVTGEKGVLAPRSANQHPIPLVLCGWATPFLVGCYQAG